MAISSPWPWPWDPSPGLVAQVFRLGFGLVTSVLGLGLDL